ncbi:MAG: GAF domain-containing protein [Bacteroidetes bacterium]|mgnify:CR=1 FL=1|nr:MAG: GAF domain-containing protein [Bacteroidota bacterium]REK03366.1 MAG: GAF domain-containing protein [Bacteroidota bacterium]REK34523.1 MAG: GAF domain-containing protein [Bacteroidota bacterium]REK50359.1 MAG: GAF domain-containing protein [Bacteroidota bacterium]
MTSAFGSAFVHFFTSLQKKDLEELLVSNSHSKEEKYKFLVPQIENLLKSENDLIACLANVCAAIRETFGFLWIGFYLVKDTDTGKELVLGPFQGPLACTRISFGKGVCGKAWEEKRLIRVTDVNKFPDHIACSSLSKSEVVVPLLHKNEVMAVLDIDSEIYACFDEIDERYLVEICKLAESKL